MATPDDAGHMTGAGGAAMELNADKTLVFLRLNRVACARMAEVLSRAAASPADALKSGSEEAEDLTDYLNMSLGKSDVAFGEVALDDTLPDALPAKRPLADKLKAGGAGLVMLFAALVFVRGIIALLSDDWAVLKTLL